LEESGLSFDRQAREAERKTRAFAQNELKPKAAYWDGETFSADDRPCSGVGHLGLTIPKKYGGQELGPIEAIIAIEEMAKACANTAEVVFDCIIGPMQVIQHFGTDEQRERYLRRAAKGEVLMGIAISEHHAGSGATDMHSRAKFDGDSVVLNGRKAFVEDVSTENAFLIYIKFDDCPGAKSIGGVIVEKGTPGFTVGAPRKKMGLRGCAQADLIFENCRVPKEMSSFNPAISSSSWGGFQLGTLRQCDHGRRHCRGRARGTMAYR
jgi:butyryl-CoA dehydrogenase